MQLVVSGRILADEQVSEDIAVSRNKEFLTCLVRVAVVCSSNLLSVCPFASAAIAGV